jgi:hypothetical protein
MSRDLIIITQNFKLFHLRIFIEFVSMEIFKVSLDNKYPLFFLVVKPVLRGHPWDKENVAF